MKSESLKENDQAEERIPEVSTKDKFAHFVKETSRLYKIAKDAKTDFLYQTFGQIMLMLSISAFMDKFIFAFIVSFISMRITSITTEKKKIDKVIAAVVLLIGLTLAVFAFVFTG